MLSSISLTASDGVKGEIKPPSSKSYTHRAIFIASLARGISTLINPLISEDTLSSVDACRAFGINLELNSGQISVKSEGTKPEVPDDIINIGNSGTTLRFLTTVMTGSKKGFTVITGDNSVRRRPMQPLLDSIAQLGGRAYSSRLNGCAPIIVEGDSLMGGEATLDASVSSQYVSSVLISSVLSKNGIMLRVKGTVSRPYIDATILTMSKFGVKVTRDSYKYFAVDRGAEYRATEFRVPSDFSSMAFLIGCVAAAGGKLRLICEDLGMPQADSKILEYSSLMGVKISVHGSKIEVEHDGSELRGGTFDLKDSPDLLPIISVLGLKSDKGVKITGVRHARFKETDRISVISQELKKAGGRVLELDDGMIVKPGMLKQAVLDSHGDHRLFMAFCIASILSHGAIKVSGKDSAKKSYPSYIDDLKSIGVKVQEEGAGDR